MGHTRVRGGRDPGARRVRLVWVCGAPFVAGLSWKIAPLVAAVAVIGLLLFWGLRVGRPAFAVYGVVGAAAVILGYGTWLYNDWVKQSQDFPRLATRVAYHAGGADAGVFGGRFFPIDFYLGRPLHRISTVAEFNEYLTRFRRPIVVVNGRTWELIHEDVPRGTAVLDAMPVRGQMMLIIGTDSGAAWQKRQQFGASRFDDRRILVIGAQPSSLRMSSSIEAPPD